MSGRARSLLLLLFAACSGPSEPTDAGGEPADAGSDAGPVGPSPIAEAIAPRMSCPAGWSVAEVEEGVSACDAFGGARERCSGASAHFVGEAGCRAIGTSCPADGLPADAPAGAVFVAAGASGGDGSRSAPLGTIDEALAVAPEGGTIAIGVGRYEGAILIRGRSLSLLGACPETILANDSTVLSAVDGAASVSNLTFAGSRNAVTARGGDVVLDDVLVEGCGQVGYVFVEGSIRATDLIARGTDLGAVGANGGEVHLERFAFEDLGGDAFDMAGATLVALDGVVDGTDPSSVTAGVLYGGATVTLERVAFASESLGSVIVDDASALSLTDVVMRSSGAAPAPRFGINGLNGGSIELTRVWLEGGSALSVGVGDPGSRLALEDVVISEMRPAPGGGEGHAIEVDTGATARLTRTWVSGAGGLGLLVTGAGAEVTAEDLTVLRTASAPTGIFGRALQIQLGAVATTTRARFAGNREATVVVARGGSRWTATDVVIEDTMERACAPGCDPGGIGVSVLDRGAVELERFRVRRGALVGVQVAFDGSLSLVDGEIADNPVGANVQVPGYDLGRLMERVLYRDNGVNLESSELPIPDPVVPGG